MVALASWLTPEETSPDSENRVWDFFGPEADFVGELALQVVEGDWEKSFRLYDSRRGYVLAKKEKPPAQKENEKPDWQKKLLEKLCGSEEGRKAVERLSKVTVNTADSIMANIEINGSVRSVEAGGFFRPGEGAVYLNVGGKSTESLSSKVVHEAVHVQQYLDLGIDGFRGLSRTDKEVPAYGTQEQFHIDMGWPAVNEHTRRYTGFLGMGGPAIDFNGIRSWQDSINSVGNYLAPTIEGLNMNVGGWECPEN